MSGARGWQFASITCYNYSMNEPARDSIVNEFAKLTPAQQAEVMSFIRALKGSPKGTPGRNLLPYAGSIPAEDLAAMEAAIKEGCEQVDQDGW